MPRFAYTKIAAAVLPDWELSLVFVGPKRARALNAQLRGATYTPNVLSYALDARSGEILICLQEAEKQAASYDMGQREFVLYLFIHGLLHLKGMAHSVTMERCERKLLAQFAKGSVRAYSHAPTHRSRNRHRHVSGKAGRR